MTITLRPYREKLISEARDKLRHTKRLMLQASCGSGKTVLAAFIIKNAAFKGKKIFFLVHRQELMMQASKTMEALNIDHGFIAARYTPKYYCPVQIAMIDTLRNRLSKITLPDIVIVDEAHHAVSPTYKKVIDFFRDNSSIIIGLSATPRRLDGKPLNDMFDDIVFGPTTKHLISLGNLANYIYYAPPSLVDMEGVKKKFGDFDSKEQAKRIDKPHIFGDAIEHYKKIMHGKRAIAFQINIQASKNFAQQCVDAGIPCLHVDGEMNTSDRANAIRSFEAGETWILSNVSLFGEGFDVSACDGVILLRKTASLSLFIQMCGRALRPHASKEKAIILDHMNNWSLHGLPDDDFDWSLDGRKKTNKTKEVESIKIKQCTQCFHVFEPTRYCPNCGYDLGAVSSEIEQIDCNLVEIKKEEQRIVQVEKKKEVSAARTLEELKKIEKERKYKVGWAYNVFKSRSNRR